MSNPNYAELKLQEAYNTNRDDIIDRNLRPITDIKDMITSSATIYANNVAFKQRFKKGEPFTDITYKEAMEDINGLGTALINMGLKDKRIAVIGENCYQWAVSYLATICGTGVVVPLDKELAEENLSGLCAAADVEAVLCTKKFSKTFNSIRESGKTQIKYIINLNLEEKSETDLAFREVIEEGKKLIADGDKSFVDAVIDPEAMAAILFTSGTTGISKGVMLCHKNIAVDLMLLPTILNVYENDVFFSVLPVHHTFECTAGFLIPLYRGSAIAYCEGLKYIQSNLKEINPSIVMLVPLIAEALYKGIWKNIRKQGKEKTVKNVINICKKFGKAGNKIQRKLLKDIYAVFGTNMRLLICGGAAMDPGILDFFEDLGFLGIQGYGLTECAPVAAVNGEILHKSASIGRPLPTIDAKIINPDSEGNGEILIKGDIVMLGYYNMQEETDKVLQDGWFHTGDIGYIDDQGFIFITGRSKNVIIASNGKNVFPEELEYCLGLTGLVTESMVWADADENGQDTVIIASIFPDAAAVEERLGANYTDADVNKLFDEEIDKLNKTLPLYKQIRRFVIRKEEFEKTTAKKIKRFVASNRAK
ncbi:MAG: AMP-binding protein [Clostridia bacterium]|nr:AMP-binding protein [Clostridia bacterium]